MDHLEDWYKSRFFVVSISGASIGFLLENKRIETIGLTGAMLAPYLDPALDLIPPLLEDIKLMMDPIHSILEATVDMFKAISKIDLNPFW